MVEKATQAGRLRRRLPSYAVIVGLVIFIPIAICHPDRFLFLDIFIVAPILFAVSVILIVCLIRAAVGNSQRQLLPILLTLTIIWAIPTSLFFYNLKHPFELHETARWLASSQHYKNKVLAQPTSANGELKHIEWDASGFAGLANNTVFLVFDPADTLSAAAKSRQPGKFNGIPCEVRLIRRLENQWYAVLFSTDEYWGQGKCN
ncbi:MAG: hypothetical protein WB987_12975 [Candidatus Acidiferrales bacterium]